MVVKKGALRLLLVMDGQAVGTPQLPCVHVCILSECKHTTAHRAVLRTASTTCIRNDVCVHLQNRDCALGNQSDTSGPTQFAYWSLDIARAFKANHSTQQHGDY